MTTFWNMLRRNIFSRYYLALLGIYTLGILSIMRANRSYLDDVGRSLYGYADWVASARPLSELFSWFFYFGPTTVDASPFTQILAVAILSLVSLLLLEALRARITWTNVLCTIPIGLSPYGLENLSYKFDSPWMAMALLLAVLPCCFMNSGRRIFLVVSALCLFGCASFYQPALGAYLCVAVYVCLTELASRRCTTCVLRRLLRFLVPFCVGVGIYTLQAPIWFEASQYSEYVAQHASIPPLMQLPAELLQNLPIYMNLLLKDWSGNGLGLLLGVLVVCFVLHLLARWRHSAKGHRSWAESSTRLLVMIILLPCFLLCPFGVQFLLTDPVWAPRTFYGFGILVALVLLSLTAFARGRGFRMFSRTVQALLLVQLLVFANVYGNLLDAQNQWELSRMSLLASDLNRYIQATGSNQVAFVGSMGLSPLAVNPAGKYPLLERLVTVPLTRNWRWGYEQLNTFGVQVQSTPVPESFDPAAETFIKTPSYSIQKGPGDVGVVTFLAPPVPKAKKTPARVPAVK